MEARNAAASPTRQLPPMPMKPRSRAARDCAVYAACDAEALVAVVEPVVCWGECSTQTMSQPGAMPLRLCRTAELCSTAVQSTPDCCWQALLPGALCDTANAAKGTGSKRSNEAQHPAEGSRTFQFSMSHNSYSSPELTPCSSGSCFQQSDGHSGQKQEQCVRVCPQQALPCSSCTSGSLLASAGGGDANGHQGSSAGASRSRLGRSTGSELPPPSVPGPPRLTCSCAGGGTIKQREESWHHCHEGAANWNLQRGTTSCSFHSSDGLARRLRIHIATFNMAGKVPLTLPPGLLGQSPSRGEQEQVDLYVFATQESGNISEWEQLLATSLPSDGSFERLAWQTLRAIHLVLYASHRFRRQVLGIRGSAVATGIGNIVGNKGAVALSVQLTDYKLLFISSHFAAHDDKVDRRNADFHRIRTGLFSSSHSSSSLAEMGAATGSHPNQCNSQLPALGNTLQMGAGAGPVDSRASSRGTSSLHGARGDVTADVTADGGNNATSISRQLTCSRARSSLHTGWTSGLWDAAGLQWVFSGRPCSVGTPHCPAIGSESASMAASSDAECSNVHQLRAASCPPDPEGVYHTQQPSLKQVSPLCCSEAGTPRNTFPEPPMPPRCVDCASPCECSSAGRSSGVHRSGLSIAEELRNQLSFFKSFMVSKTSSGLLGSRSLVAGGATADHDVVFWVGDLNYRINGNSKAVGYLLRSRLHEVLHANDQLRLQQKKGKVFQGYQEGRIHFPPTFKFLQGTSQYSEQRVPSWTDRILWKVRVPEALADELAPTVQQTYYSSVPEVVSSDHKPVVAGFELLLTAAEVPCVDADKRSLNSRCCIM